MYDCVQLIRVAHARAAKSVDGKRLLLFSHSTDWSTSLSVGIMSSKRSNTVNSERLLFALWVSAGLLLLLLPRPLSRLLLSSEIVKNLHPTERGRALRLRFVGLCIFLGGIYVWYLSFNRVS